jgi:hypothetical protein
VGSLSISLMRRNAPRVMMSMGTSIFIWRCPVSRRKEQMDTTINQGPRVKVILLRVPKMRMSMPATPKRPV